MDGQLLVAPVLREDSEKHFRLPEGTWFPFESSKDQCTVTGPREVSGKADLDEIPVFAPAGSIIPLAPLVQYTGALPGGPLEVRVYPGKDASFELFEDDGESVDYQSGKVRSIKFSWNEAKHELSWTATGARQSTSFSHLTALYFHECDSVRSNKFEISSAGAIQFDQSN
mmetsp:Transcript_151293/g.384587  ORF Transcript_151293/g.384587 Transcript_151293/m.384587 type:complete len:170 (-) Transcript_151293:6-515(-)